MIDTNVEQDPSRDAPQKQHRPDTTQTAPAAVTDKATPKEDSNKE